MLTFKNATTYTQKPADAQWPNFDWISDVEEIRGSNASDRLSGNSTNNVFNGRGGNDTLKGGAGEDRIQGGAGADILYGNKGDDRFIYKAASESTKSAMDIIKDFDDSGNDRIDLSAFSGTLDYMHTGKFAGAGEVRTDDVSGPDVLVEVNLSGDKSPELVIRLENTTASSMSAGDFIL